MASPEAAPSPNESAESETAAPDCLPVRLIIERVGRHFDIAPDEITGPTRRAYLIEARHVSMYLARQHSGLSFPEIVRRFNRRDHTTVIYACAKIEALQAESPELREKIEAIRAELITG